MLMVPTTPMKKMISAHPIIGKAVKSSEQKVKIVIAKKKSHKEQANDMLQDLKKQLN